MGENILRGKVQPKGTRLLTGTVEPFCPDVGAQNWVRDRTSEIPSFDPTHLTWKADLNRATHARTQHVMFTMSRLPSGHSLLLFIHLGIRLFVHEDAFLPLALMAVIWLNQSHFISQIF